MRRHVLVLLLLYLCLESWSALFGEARTLPTQSLFQKTEEIPLRPGQMRYELRYWPILPDSEKVVWKDKQRPLRRGLDYILDADAGQLTLHHANLSGTLEVHYSILPFALERVYRRDLFGKRAAAEKEKGAPPDEGVQEAGTTFEGEPQLEVSGTKTFSVGLGSQRGLTPNQSLRLNVSGQITPSVRILAVLSDQDLPFQAEGTTESLEAIDQKLIRVESPHMTATLGNFQAELGNPDVFFPRALQGVQVDLKAPWGELRLIPSAIPEGFSSSKTFQGIEGQNSYRVDLNGQYIVMKAGSETVWLNGERMRRGENNDYVIRDYGDPIIEFTSRHLITANDVIRVDFEYLPEDLDYRQTLSGLRGQWLLPGERGHLGLSYAVEADDPSTPFLVLTEAEKSALARDIRELDGRPLPVPKKHSVVGLEAQYLVGQHTQLQGQWALSSVDENRLSQRDRIAQHRAWNLDLITTTSGLRLSGTWRHQDALFAPIGATVANRDRFQYEQLYAEQDFEDLLLLGQPAALTPSTEDQLRTEIRATPLRWAEITGSWSQSHNRFLEEASPETTRRNWHVGVNLRPEKWPRIRYEQYGNTTLTGGDPDFEKGRRNWEVSYAWRQMRWSVFGERMLARDRNLTDSFNRNRRRERQGARMEWARGRHLQLSAELSREFRFTRDEIFPVDGEPLGFGPWRRIEVARTGTLGTQVRPNLWFDLSGHIARRVLRQESGQDLETNLADVEARIAPWRRALDLRFQYEVDKRLESQKEEIFTNVLFGRVLKPGEGTHVKLDEYHYQRDPERGDYVRLVRTVGDRPVASVQASVQINLSPRRVGFPGWTRQSASSRTDATQMPSQRSMGETVKTFLRRSLDASLRWEVVEEQEKMGDLDLYLLRALRTADTLFGRQHLRYRLGFTPLPRLRLEATRSEQRTLDRRFDNRQRQRTSEEWETTGTLDVTESLSVGVHGERRRSTETLIDFGIQGNDPRAVSDLFQDERARSVQVRYRWNLRWTLETELRRESEVARDPLFGEGTTRTQTKALETRVRYAWPGKGRLNLDYRLAQGQSQGELPVARYNFYDGISHELRCTLEYRTAQFTDLLWRFNYRLLVTEQEKPDHRVQLEVAAEL